MSNSQGWRILSFIFFIAFTSTVFARTAEDIRSNSYFFEFLTFKTSDANQTFLEVFCQIPTENLHFVNADDGVIARYSLSIELMDRTANVADTLSISDSVKVSYDDGDSYIPATHLIRFAFSVVPGDYVARIILADRHTKWGVQFNKDLSIPDYQTPGLHVSDIQVAANITQSSEESVLVKNNKKIVPNPPRVYGMEKKKLFAYTEVYNLSQGKENVANSFLATYRIIDRFGKEVKRIKYKFKKPGHTGAFGVGIPVDELNSGQYRLVMEVQDLDSFESRYKVASFHIIKYLSAFSDDEYEKMLRQLAYLATDYELEYLASLSKEARTDGLRRFWQARDPIQETERNELKQEYMRRLYYANYHFDDITTEGWETDQGKTYIMNGPPDKIDHLTSSTNSKDYEIWNYSNLNRKFIFVDNWGLGTYQLVKTVDASEQVLSLHPSE